MLRGFGLLYIFTLMSVKNQKILRCATNDIFCNQLTISMRWSAFVTRAEVLF